MKDIKLEAIKPLSGESAYMPFFTESVARQIAGYHASFESYSPTPLRSLGALAGHMGVKGLFVKDESYRFGLNAFKALGGSYAIGRYLAERLGLEPEHMTYEKLVSEESRARLGELTFVTATDGNHGRGVAWTARMLGQKCRVYMPAGSVSERVQNIRAQGAVVTVTELNYDDTVRMVDALARENGWIVVQDTAWDGYEQIPLHIMQGYLTMAYEAVRQLNGAVPTHVFLQAGVGSMAGAVAAFLVNYYGKNAPVIAVVEPDHANCHYLSAQSGERRFSAGPLDTMMAGLACGEPNPISWELLRRCAQFCISCPDDVSADGMRILGAPQAGDPRIISGESGAVTSGLAARLMLDEQCADVRNTLGLNADSVILCVNTEGATDRANYRGITWFGQKAAPWTERNNTL